MVPHRAPTLCFWLAAILVVALGMLVPNLAWAHAGHGAHAGHARQWAASAPEGSSAVLSFDHVEELQENAPVAGAAAARLGESASIACGGAGCCNTGHGCCAAIPAAAAAAPAMPVASQPEAVLAGLPPGVAAAALPEPPRPFR
jgi:hypothetical protein